MVMLRAAAAAQEVRKVQVQTPATVEPVSTEGEEEAATARAVRETMEAVRTERVAREAQHKTAQQAAREVLRRAVPHHKVQQGLAEVAAEADNQTAKVAARAVQAATALSGTRPMVPAAEAEAEAQETPAIRTEEQAGRAVRTAAEAEAVDTSAGQAHQAPAPPARKGSL